MSIAQLQTIGLDVRSIKRFLILAAWRPDICRLMPMHHGCWQVQPANVSCGPSWPIPLKKYY